VYLIDTSIKTNECAPYFAIKYCVTLNSVSNTHPISNSVHTHYSAKFTTNIVMYFGLNGFNFFLKFGYFGDYD
jgi:hypothetical protein